MRESLERWFRLAEHGTDVGTEVVAGLTTFLTMSYIVFVQPAVLSGGVLGIETGMDFGAVMVATCLSAALATAVMGLYARYPIAQAPGMGQNFFFVMTILPAASAVGHPEPWRAALGVVFVAGVLFVLISLLGVRELLMDAMSPSMKAAMAAGIGLFIAFIGLRNAGLIVGDPGTIVALTDRLASPDLAVFFVGLFVTAVLQARAVRGALLYGIASALGFALSLRALVPLLPGMAVEGGALTSSLLLTRFSPTATMVAAPPSLAPTFFAMDVLAALSPALVPMVILVLFMDVFDTMGTLVAVTESGGLTRDGRLARGRRAMRSDAVGTVAGACLGTSTVTSYVESATGVEEGGRTGLVAVVVAALFLVTLLFAPLVGMVASYPPLTAPALVVVGGLMMRSVSRIDWEDRSESIPAFLTLAGIPLTYSIADGLALGIVSYAIVKLCCGRGSEVGWLMRGLAVVLVAYFLLLR